MNPHTIQATVVDQKLIRPSQGLQRIAFFGPDGAPLTLNDDSSSKDIKALKSRLTKLENRVKELEGGA